MPAGNYAIANDMDTNFITIRNVKTNDSVLALGTRQSPSKTTESWFSTMWATSTR